VARGGGILLFIFRRWRAHGDVWGSPVTVAWLRCWYFRSELDQRTIVQAQPGNPRLSDALNRDAVEGPKRAACRTSNKLATGTRARSNLGTSRTGGSLAATRRTGGAGRSSTAAIP